MKINFLLSLEKSPQTLKFLIFASTKVTKNWNNFHKHFNPLPLSGISDRCHLCLRIDETLEMINQRRWKHIAVKKKLYNFASNLPFKKRHFQPINIFSRSIWHIFTDKLFEDKPTLYKTITFTHSLLAKIFDQSRVKVANKIVNCWIFILSMFDR